MNNGLEPTNPSLPPSAEELTVQNEVSSETSLEQTPLNSSAQIVDPEPPKRRSWRRVAGLSLLGIGVVAIAALVLFSLNGKKPDTGAQLSATTRIKPQSVALADLSKQLENASAQELSTLTINGEASVSDSLILQPTSQPDNATAGQIYYDTAKNLVRYYNGKQFINLQGAISTQTINVIGGDTITNVFGSTVNNNITNITNVSGGGVSVTSGTVGTLAMFTGASSIGDSLVSQSGSTLNLGNSATGIQLGNSASNHNIQIGIGNGVQTVTVGSGSTTSTTTIQAGTGSLTLGTGDSTSASGNIFITTGNSSTTAAGDITIDAGTGIIDGEVVEDKTFESGLENMDIWFGSTIATTSSVAHTGNSSLAETGTAPNWGIIEILPGVSVTPGHQYLFSMWVRAGTTPRTILGSAAWNGSTTTVNFPATVDSTSGWTEITALGTAPADATSVYFRAQGVGVAGEVHYFDDMTVTDLSSASAAASLSIGNTNAKIVTLGNLNQIGATSIYGGSGINLNSGAGSLNMTGGVVAITGNASSNFTTASGALTLTSAAAATWSVATASNGVGGDLSLHAGNGGGGNFNGGNLILRGGNGAGTGLPGGVFIAPGADATNTFVIQNSSAASLFAADASTMTITIAGTTANFGTLLLDNAHFKSTQTTAPTTATPTNCGATPSAAVTAGSTDSAGSFTVTTGTGGTSSTCDTVITFDKPYGGAPKSILVVGKTDATSAARQIYVSASNANSFTVTFGASAAGADNTAYSFNYWVVE
jgi:hypothetical protein